MAETEPAQVLRWWALERGDIDATVAQVGFNVAQMIIPAFLLVPVGHRDGIQRRRICCRASRWDSSPAPWD